MIILSTDSLLEKVDQEKDGHDNGHKDEEMEPAPALHVCCPQQPVLDTLHRIVLLSIVIIHVIHEAHGVARLFSNANRDIFEK